RAPGRSVPPGSARPLPTAPGGHPVRQSSAAGSTPCGRLAALATPHARTPTAAANVLPADWAHGLRPPRRTDTSLAASWPGLFASRGRGSVSGPPSPSAPTHATLPLAPIVLSCDTNAPRPALLSLL